MLGLLTRSTVLSSVLVANIGNTLLTVNLSIKNKTEKGNKIVETNILLDTGAGGMFMNQEYMKKRKIIYDGPSHHEMLMEQRIKQGK